MKFFAIAALVSAASAAASAQQPPDVGVNYKQQPFVYDLLARLEPMPPLFIYNSKEQESFPACKAEMMRALRQTGLAEKGRDAYRACVEKAKANDAAAPSDALNALPQQ